MAMLIVAFVGCSKEENNNTNGGTEHSTSDDWVDLGLPSGLLWASCNVGASAPEDYGDYFSWGESQNKSVYDWSTYAYGTFNQLTKYCNNAYWGLNGFTDTLTTLVPADDAATVRLGDGVRTPTKEEWEELLDNTTVEWTTLNGVNGRMFTATNGHTLFLPAAGTRYNSVLSRTDSLGLYWSSSLFTDYAGNAWNFYFTSDTQYMCNEYYRYGGNAVRAVRSAQ